jgi:hypothetical protein
MATSKPCFTLFSFSCATHQDQRIVISSMERRRRPDVRLPELCLSGPAGNERAGHAVFSETVERMLVAVRRR